MTQPYPCCNYDLPGASTSICPECGFDVIEVAKKRKRFSTTSRHWIKLFVAAIMYSTYLRAQDHSELDRIEPIAIVLATIGFLLVVSFMGVLMNLHKPYEVRMTEFLLWLRCSFWLHLPWIIISPLGHYGTNDWKDAEQHLTTPYILLPFLGFIIWMYQ